MRRIFILLGAAMIGSALLPAMAQAQVVVQVGRPYLPPVIVTQPVRPVYYVTPSVTYSPPYTSTYSFYPQSTVYSAPPVTYAAPVVSYSAPVISYAPPAAVVAPAGVVQTRTYYGYGVFRPRGYYTETRVYP